MNSFFKKNKWLVILGLVIILLAIFAYIKGKTRPKGKAVEVTKVEVKTIKETVSASGKIYPKTEVKISSDVSGEIIKLYVSEGDSVTKGQIIAEINPETYVSSVQRGEATLNSSKAQLQISKSNLENSVAQSDQIKAQLDNAKKVHERNVQLKQEGVISQADLDQSYMSLKGLEASLRASQASIAGTKDNIKASEYSIKGAQASLNEMKISLSRTIIRAPMSGIVSSLSVEQGERVVGTMQMTGTEIMRISDLSQMEVQVDVSENDILKVSLGDSVGIDVDAFTGKTLYGKVSEVGSSASNIASSTVASTTNQVTNFTVTVAIESESYKAIRTNGLKYPLRPGMSASVEIFTNEVKDVVAVPIQVVAVRQKNEDEESKSVDDYNEVVFTIQNDTATMNIVKTGIQDDEYIEIKSGLEKDMEVIKGPYSEVSKILKSGDKVHIKKEEKKTK